MHLSDITKLWHSFTMPRKTKIHLAGCVLCFVVFYAIFYALLYGQTQADFYSTRLVQQAKAHDIHMTQPIIQFFPPNISIDSIQLTGKGNAPLTLHNIIIDVNIFSASGTVKAQLLGGNLEGTVEASSLFSPEHLQIDMRCDALALPELASFAGLQQGSLIRILTGTLEGRLQADIPLNDRGFQLGASKGSLTLRMQQGAVSHGVPLLVAEKLENLEGNVELTWENRDVSLERLLISNHNLTINLDGQIVLNLVKPLDSTIAMKALVRMPLEQVRQELVPPRTLQSLQKNQQVRMRITKTLRSPLVNVIL